MQYTLLFDPAAVFNVRVVIVGEEGENLKRGKLFIWSQEKRAFRWVFFALLVLLGENGRHGRLSVIYVRFSTWSRLSWKGGGRIKHVSC
jgi:hypothetical protein